MPGQLAAVLLKEYILGVMMITAWCLLSISDNVAFAALAVALPCAWGKHQYCT